MNNNLGPRYQVENHRLPFARSSSSGSSNGNPKPPAVPAANDDDAWSAWLAQTAKNAAAKTAAKTVHVRDHVVDRLPRERLLHTNHHEGGGLEKSGDHGHGPRQSFHPEKHNVLDHTDLLDAPPTIAHIEGGSSTLSGDWQDHDGHLGQRIPKKTFSRPMSQQHHDGDQQQHPTPHWRREVSSPASGPSTRYDVADEQSGRNHHRQTAQPPAGPDRSQRQPSGEYVVPRKNKQQLGEEYIIPRKHPLVLEDAARPDPLHAGRPDLRLSPTLDDNKQPAGGYVIPRKRPFRPEDAERPDPCHARGPDLLLSTTQGDHNNPPASQQSHFHEDLLDLTLKIQRPPHAPHPLERHGRSESSEMHADWHQHDERRLGLGVPPPSLHHGRPPIPVGGELLPTQHQRRGPNGYDHGAARSELVHQPASVVQPAAVSPRTAIGPAPADPRRRRSRPAPTAPTTTVSTLPPRLAPFTPELAGPAHELLRSASQSKHGKDNTRAGASAGTDEDTGGGVRGGRMEVPPDARGRGWSDGALHKPWVGKDGANASYSESSGGGSGRRGSDHYGRRMNPLPDTAPLTSHGHNTDLIRLGMVSSGTAPWRNTGLSGGPLAVYVEGVTLGSRLEPPSGVHVRLPLRHQSQPVEVQGPLAGVRPALPRDHEPEQDWQLQQRPHQRHMPLPHGQHGPPRVSMPFNYDHGPADPVLRHTPASSQRPWPESHGSAHTDSTRDERAGPGGDAKGRSAGEWTGNMAMNIARVPQPHVMPPPPHGPLPPEQFPPVYSRPKDALQTHRPEQSFPGPEGPDQRFKGPNGPQQMLSGPRSPEQMLPRPAGPDHRSQRVEGSELPVTGPPPEPLNRAGGGSGNVNDVGTDGGVGGGGGGDNDQDDRRTPVIGQAVDSVTRPDTGSLETQSSPAAGDRTLRAWANSANLSTKPLTKNGMKKARKLANRERRRSEALELLKTSKANSGESAIEHVMDNRAVPETEVSPTSEGTAQPLVQAGKGTSADESARAEGSSPKQIVHLSLNASGNERMASANADSDAAGAGSLIPDASAAAVNVAGVPRKVAHRRLAPTPLAKMAWSVADLATRFPRLGIPESLTHAIASWAVLDTRAIGVVPMICQPVGEKDSKDQDGEEVVSDGGSGDEARRSSLGKRKRKVDRNPPGPIRSGKQSAGKRATPEQEWEARVLVPFGVMAEKAAEGCWAEAFRLVLTPPPDSSTTAHTNAATGGSICSRDENGGDNNGGGGDSSSIGIRSSSDHGSGRRGRRDGDQEGDAGEYAAGKQQGAERIMAMDLPGGRWNADLDGGDPEVEDHRALITTAVRTAKSSCGVDLRHCSTWLKFCELHHDDRTTIVFLCGGGARVAEGKEQKDLHVGTISELIDGIIPSHGGGISSGNERQSEEATFEARLCAEFLWGLVSRDWAGVVLDSLRTQAALMNVKKATADTAVASGSAEAGTNPGVGAGAGSGVEVRAGAESSAGAAGSISAVEQAEGSGTTGNSAGENSPETNQCGKEMESIVSSMAETPAEVRAAFGLFDLDDDGWLAGDRLEKILVDAGFRLSGRYLRSLLRSVCNVASGVGKRWLFEYRRRLTAAPAPQEQREEEGTLEGENSDGANAGDIATARAVAAKAAADDPPSCSANGAGAPPTASSPEFSQAPAPLMESGTSAAITISGNGASGERTGMDDVEAKPPASVAPVELADGSASAAGSASMKDRVTEPQTAGDGSTALG